jgi:hypothetical protein
MSESFQTTRLLAKRMEEEKNKKLAEQIASYIPLQKAQNLTSSDKLNYEKEIENLNNKIHDLELKLSDQNTVVSNLENERKAQFNENLECLKLFLSERVIITNDSKDRIGYDEFKYIFTTYAGEGGLKINLREIGALMRELDYKTEGANNNKTYRGMKLLE